jgi:hypothetical protein
MATYLKNKFRSMPWSGWILAIIILVGFFLRAYNFHDWLRFNADQARDAQLVDEVVSGKTSWPLLGPKAGGTDFRLGPAFYYFSISSAKAFGNYPDKMAYPDLIFSLLSIGLLYLLLKKYFATNISLGLTSLYSVSFFAVKYSRFSWNPNSLPFFTMLFLYSLLEIMSPKQNRKILWSMICGASLGVGIQLHSLFLFIMPLIILLVFAYLFFKKNPAWKMILPIIAIALFFNTPQIYSELAGKSRNIEAFVSGMANKTGRTKSIWNDVSLDAACHLQANSLILTAGGGDDNCVYLKTIASKKPVNFPFVFEIILSIIFSLGGYILFVQKIGRETELEKKHFLCLMALLTGLTFIMLIPLANEISMRFFLIIEFIPFILLGLWAEFLIEYKRPIGVYASSIILAMLLVMNIISIRKEFTAIAFSDPSQRKSIANLSLGELESMSEFIIANTPNGNRVLVSGRKKDLFKLVKPLQYLARKSSVKIAEESKKNPPKSGDALFYIGHRKEKEPKKELPKSIGQVYNIASLQAAGRFVIFKIDPK